MNYKKLKKHFSLAVYLLAGAVMTLSACSADDLDEGGVSETDSYTYKMIATGQVNTYDKDGNVVTVAEGDACYGQDGNYLAGAEMSFTKNGDGTVTDNNSGLMWQEIPTSQDFTYADAQAYCDSLNLAGYDDWRVPTLKELFSIANFSVGWPYIDLDVFSLASGEISKDEQYWSCNAYVGVTAEGGENAVFGVNEVTGHIKAYAGSMPEGGVADGLGTGGPQGTDDEGTGFPPPPGADTGGSFNNPMLKYVRAVRSTDASKGYGENDFVANGDATVTDKATGLMWSQDDDGVGMEWEAALAYAESSTLAGYTDWRLPNIKELESIADYNYSPSATDEAHLGAALNPDFFNCTAIVNEAGNADYGYYWSGTSARFNIDGAYSYAWYYAAGRAVNNEGIDFHGAGAVRFDTKYEGGNLGEGGERYTNFVRLVRNVK